MGPGRARTVMAGLLNCGPPPCRPLQAGTGSHTHTHTASPAGSHSLVDEFARLPADKLKADAGDAGGAGGCGVHDPNRGEHVEGCDAALAAGAVDGDAGEGVPLGSRLRTGIRCVPPNCPFLRPWQGQGKAGKRRQRGWALVCGQAEGGSLWSRRYTPGSALHAAPTEMDWPQGQMPPLLSSRPRVTLPNQRDQEPTLGQREGEGGGGGGGCGLGGGGLGGGEARRGGGGGGDAATTGAAGGEASCTAMVPGLPHIGSPQ